MSRAFVKESDGWHFCRLYLQTCLHADESGKCMRSECELEEQWLADEDEETDETPGPSE